MTLLSHNSTNLAIPAGDMDYPSLCVSTMIGDEAFDAIVLKSKSYRELFPFLRRLLIRLRNRFPNAPIIVLQARSPQDY
jgi:hypothetical protein